MSAVIERPVQTARLTRVPALRPGVRAVPAPACMERPGSAGAFARALRDL